MLDSLSKIYHANPKAHVSEYLSRFSSPSAIHLPLQIKQFNHEKEYQAFFYYEQELVILMEQIYSQFANFTRTLREVSPIVMQQFGRNSDLFTV